MLGSEKRLPLSLLCAVLAWQSGAHAGALTVAAMGDSDDGNACSAALELPVGNHGWLQFGLGRAMADSSDDDIRSTIATIRGGRSGEHLGFSLGYTRNDGGATLTEQDVSATFDVFSKRGGLGIDLFYREGESELDATVSGRRRTYAVHSEQEFSGYGIGAHAQVDLSVALTLALRSMWYDYSDVTTDTRINNRFRFLSESPGLRSTALNENSLGARLDYRFARAVAALDYTRDEALGDGAIAHTVQLSVELPMGDFIVMPALGYLSSEDENDLLFGAVEITYAW